ncbi:MAG: hypothetical protein MJZ20_07100 [Bacteroidaceae bacterium]|nr:hypothetical protein [Bacteroidaceae bacterium]
MKFLNNSFIYENLNKSHAEATQPTSLIRFAEKAERRKEFSTNRMQSQTRLNYAEVRQEMLEQNKAL